MAKYFIEIKEWLIVSCRLSIAGAKIHLVTLLLKKRSVDNLYRPIPQDIIAVRLNDYVYTIP